MDEYFKHVCTILLCKDVKRVSDSVTIIRNVNKKNSEKNNDYENTDNLAEDEYAEILYDNEESDTIYRSSPFFQRYDATLTLLKQELEIDDDDDDDDGDYEGSNTNQYYAPKFVQHLLVKWMPYAVLWSSLDIDLIDPTISRISNAFVESSHKVTKEIDFEGIRNRSVADRVHELRKSADEILANLELDAPIKCKSSRQKPKYPVTEPNPILEETWKRGKHEKRTKGHYHMKTLKKLQEKLNMDTEENEKENNPNINNIIHDESEKKISEEKVMENRKRKLKHDNRKTVKKAAIKSKKSELKKAFQEEKEEVLMEQNLSNSMMNISENENNEVDFEFQSIKEAVNNTVIKKIDKFYNGLIRDVNYYMTSKSSTLSIIRCSMDNSISMNTFELSAQEFSTLCKDRWIDGLVIDSFVATSISEWINVTYVPTDDTATILGQYSCRRTNKQRSISKTNKPMKDNLFLSYQFEGHWRVMIVNVKEKKLTLLDPYENETDRIRCIDAFKYFIANCALTSSFENLKNIAWNNTELHERPYQPEDDTNNCGIYIMYYMDCVGKQVPFEKTFNPSAYRREIAYKLLLKSDNIQDICLYCFGKINFDFVTCKVCERKSHTKCLYKSEVNTDEEEHVIKEKIRMVNAPVDVPETFICKLCKKYKNGYYAKYC